MSDKPFHLPEPAPVTNPNLGRQTQTGSITNFKVGQWVISGSVIKSGGITLDASKPYILLNDGTDNRVVLGNI